jgi:hypothetical protein
LERTDERRWVCPQRAQGFKAKEDLEKVRVICGTDCEAYRLLRNAIDGTVTY